MALDFFAGCVGGAAGVVVGHPLDTVKVRLQTQSPTNIKYRGTFHCLSTIVKQESVSGLYKGISSPLLGVAGVNAIIFGVYGALRPYVSGSPGNDALWAHFAAGSISGAVQSVVASPMELVKTRMQINQDTGSSKKVGALDVLKGIYRNEGGLLRGVFKGWGITLAREIPGFGFYFASYEAMTQMGDGQVGTLGMLMAGGMAGVISWIVTFPIDVVKTRLQCDDRRKYTGIIDCIRKTYSAEGYQAFSRGLVSTLLRAFPTNAATFTVVTWIMRFAEETPQDDIQSSRQYLDELLVESTRLQERFENSLRLKVPNYLSCGNSLTSSSLASQFVSSAQRYSDKTQVYFNFYQSAMQQQAEQAKAEEAEEEEVEEDNVGVGKKSQVSLLLHEKITMNIHNDDHISIRGGSENQGIVACDNNIATAQMKNVTQSSRKGDEEQCRACHHDNNEFGGHNRKGESAVQRNNHKHEQLVLAGNNKLDAELVNTTTTISDDETRVPSVMSSSMSMITDKNTKLSDGHVRNGRSNTSFPVQGSEQLSHEVSSFPVQPTSSPEINANSSAKSYGNKSTAGAASDAHKNAVECLNSYGENDGVTHHASNSSKALSSTDLTYLSKKLDIPAHIINAATLQQKYIISRMGATKESFFTSQTQNAPKVKEASSSPRVSTTTLTRQSGVNVPANNSSARAQAWLKYCAAPALNFCKCLQCKDHCVCYF